jgi:hypothetical protein
MPAPFIPLPIPQVPSIAGVPALFAQGPALAAQALALFDAPGVLTAPSSMQWGIYAANSSSPLLPADSVASVEYAQDYRISDYPQEQGAFESYNKVQVPFQSKVGFLLNQEREPFLQSIGAQLASLNLVTVITPEISYPNANLTHYGYRRVARDGVTLIHVDVWCEEVRLTATTQVSSTATASQNGAAPASDGTVQPDQTTTSPVNPVTGQLNQGIPPNPSGASTETTLTSPTIGPAFYTGDNLPTVPNDASALGSTQLSSTLTFGQSIQAQQAVAYAPITTTTGALPTPNTQTVAVGSSIANFDDAVTAQ